MQKQLRTRLNDKISKIKYFIIKLKNENKELKKLSKEAPTNQETKDILLQLAKKDELIAKLSQDLKKYKDTHKQLSEKIDKLLA